MMFIVRSETRDVPPLDVRMVRLTPAVLPGSAGWIDFFCLGDPDAAQAVGWPVVRVHDGWYADDHGGGVAIWGQGLFWEVRDTPFSVRQACGPDEGMAGPPGPHKTADGSSDATTINVRQAIFRG
jgi:hypothetical protein